MITAKDIREKNFNKAEWGYRSEEVDEYLSQLETELEGRDKEREESNHRIELLADKVREYMKDEAVIRDALLDARKNGHRITAEANEKAEKILKDAREEATTLLEEAHRQHEMAMEQYRIEITRQEEALTQIKKMVAEFKRNLFDMYQEHLEKVTAIPEENQDFPPAAKETAEVEIDKAKDEILEAAMTSFPKNPEQIPVQNPESTTPFTALPFPDDAD